MKKKKSLWETIRRPTLLVDEETVRSNIARMAGLARRSGVIFRPHFKTHQSAVIGNWYRDYGVSAITVSSVTMARYFARHGWQDITVAFPVNLRETEEINTLAGEIQLNILVEHPETAKALTGRLKYETGVFIEIDTGYRRTGVHWDDTDPLEEIMEILHKAPQLRFRGFLSHTGDTYAAASAKEIKELYRTAVERMNYLKKKYLPAFPGLLLSLGDTPSFSLLDSVTDIDEMRPGNFVFYDLMQMFLGSCTWENIAVAMACPVVALYPERKETVIYGGAVHFSKDYLIRNGRKIYGMAVRLTPYGLQLFDPPVYLTGLSQEHGIISMDTAQMKAFRRRDLITVLPVHSCLTANLMSGYLTTSGKKADHLNGNRESTAS